MLNAYSRRKDGNALLSRSFRVREFACRDGSDPLFVDSALVQLLQSIRDHVGAPVVITAATAPPPTTRPWAVPFTASTATAEPPTSGWPVFRWSSLPPTRKLCCPAPAALAATR